MLKQWGYLHREYSLGYRGKERGRSDGNGNSFERDKTRGEMFEKIVVTLFVPLSGFISYVRLFILENPDTSTILFLPLPSTPFYIVF